MSWTAHLAALRKRVGESQTVCELGENLLAYLDLKEDPTSLLQEFVEQAQSEVREAVKEIGIVARVEEDYDYDVFLIFRNYDYETVRRTERAVAAWIPGRCFFRVWLESDKEEHAETWKSQVWRAKAGDA